LAALEASTFPVRSGAVDGNHDIPHALVLNHQDKLLVRPTPKVSNTTNESWKVESYRLLA
jgi:hypothetical protein